MGSRVRKPSKKFKPTPIPPHREFQWRLESLEGEDKEFASVTLDLRRIIPYRDDEQFYRESRAVIKAAEQIHARMMVMGYETKHLHELGPETWDSYLFAAYSALRAGLSEAITFEEVDATK